MPKSVLEMLWGIKIKNNNSVEMEKLTDEQIVAVGCYDLKLYLLRLKAFFLQQERIQAEMKLPENKETISISGIYTGYCKLEDTHCNAGHELTVDNVLKVKRGKFCRICRREYFKLRPRKFTPPTHCKRGHKYTANTTYFNSKGFRDCKVCRAMRLKEQYYLRCKAV